MKILSTLGYKDEQTNGRMMMVGRTEKSTYNHGHGIYLKHEENIFTKSNWWTLAKIVLGIGIEFVFMHNKNEIWING